MKTILRTALAAVVAGICCAVVASSDPEPLATCLGADPCKACSNCKYCAHCKKAGATCGICKPSTPPPKKK